MIVMDLTAAGCETRGAIARGLIRRGVEMRTIERKQVLRPVWIVEETPAGTVCSTWTVLGACSYLDGKEYKYFTWGDM